jgi:hypothetical protein
MWTCETNDSIPRHPYRVLALQDAALTSTPLLILITLATSFTDAIFTHPLIPGPLSYGRVTAFMI